MRLRVAHNDIASVFRLVEERTTTHECEKLLEEHTARCTSRLRTKRRDGAKTWCLTRPYSPRHTLSRFRAFCCCMWKLGTGLTPYLRRYGSDGMGWLEPDNVPTTIRYCRTFRVCIALSAYGSIAREMLQLRRGKKENGSRGSEGDGATCRTPGPKI